MHVDAKVQEFFQRPRWIVMEGMNGCGKTTLTAALHRTLNAEMKLDCYLHKEVISDLYDHLNKRLHDPQSQTEEQVFLALAQRLQSYTSYVKPALEKGYCVLQDRGHMSTRVYQGHLREHGLDIIEKAVGVSDQIARVIDTVDLVVFIDTPFALAVSRRLKTAMKHGQPANTARFNEIHTAYQSEFQYASKCIRIDGSKPTAWQMAELFEKIASLE